MTIGCFKIGKTEVVRVRLLSCEEEEDDDEEVSVRKGGSLNFAGKGGGKSAFLFKESSEESTRITCSGPFELSFLLSLLIRSRRYSKQLEERLAWLHTTLSANLDLASCIIAAITKILVFGDQPVVYERDVN